jgi:DNA gyrase subunit B
MVELINQGHLFIAQPPLYRVVKGKMERWLYNEKDLTSMPYDGVDIRSDDGSIRLTGTELPDIINYFSEIEEGFNKLAEKGFPREVSRILLKNDAMHRIKYPTPAEMATVNNWFSQLPQVKAESRFDHAKQEYTIEISIADKKLKVDKLLFEEPAVNKCFRTYPAVRHLTDNKSYTFLRNKKEITKNVPWDQLATTLKKTSDTAGATVQRYKGLGEMSAEQLWETTMNPEKRELLEVTIEDAARADQLFNMLMGEEVPPRKAYIQAHAKSVKNLDI